MREAARAQGAEAARQSAEIASELDRLAERLGNEAGESDDARKLGEELARLRDLRNRLADVERQLAAQQPNARWDDARQLIDELRREGSLGVTPDDARRFNPGQSAPGTEAWKQDFSRWDDLKVQIAAALEQAESTAAARLRQQQAQERLNAGASQTVPERYRRLVDKYYRALAAGRADR